MSRRTRWAAALVGAFAVVLAAAAVTAPRWLGVGFDPRQLFGGAAPAGTETVSVLGDSHSGWPGSWFRQSVGDGGVPGAQLGTLASYPGWTSVALLTRVPEATRRGGTVLVQAGTNDMLLAGSSPARAADDVERLVGAVGERGVRPILVSVPPSATQGPQVLQLNTLLHGWADERGIGWLDVTSTVMVPDGTWRPGLSDDGIHANAAGGSLMAEAAVAELPALLRG
ncbi:SGNH/GDSL hydrolase family protein [Sinomonas atrocyanea]|uniref:SGNH/GDSL hydrolase family protein n=1 Tax=Sinomonas atrocyanea TaxID=37927 RepID=UPI003D97C75C